MKVDGPVALGRVAILGATGATGIHIARALSQKWSFVRVVGRDAGRLARAFTGLPVVRAIGDVRDPAAVERLIADCDLAFDCVGVPVAEFDAHVATARAIAAAARATGTRIVHVSSYWSYAPIHGLPLGEDHPRQGGNRLAQVRREAEDILQEAGAAVLQLPDFYGPEVHSGTLQRALEEAVAGRTVNWVGALDVPREYVFVVDAAAVALRLAACAEAYGARWLMPGPGPLTARAALAIAEAHLRRRIRARAAAPWLLRLLAPLSRDVRDILPMAPTYAAPIAYDGGRLSALIGAVPRTAYALAIPRTLDWLRARR